MKKLLILALLCLGAGMLSRGAGAQTTLNLSDCSQSSLQTEWNAMSSGAYVLVFPSCAAGGTGTWTSQLSLTVPAGVTSLTIEGATTTSCTGTAGTSSYGCTATDATVIEDAYQSSNAPLVITTGSSSTTFRMTGMTIEGGSIGSTANTKYQGIVQFFGSSQNFRVTQCHFNVNTYSPSNNGAPVYVGGAIYGVIDHSVFDLGGNSSVNNGVTIYNESQDTVGYGDGTYNAATGLGSANFLFLENNQVNGGAGNDCGHSGRFVWRYNTFSNNFLPIQSHPTSYPDEGRFHGCRAFEVYHNYFTSNFNYSVMLFRSGTGVVWDNTVANSSFQVFLAMYVDRADSSSSVNHEPGPPPNYWGQCGANVQYSGNGSGWDGNLDGIGSAPGYPCLDQIGRGQYQQSLNGLDFPNALNKATGTIAWPGQYLEPLYEWGDSFTPTSGGGWVNNGTPGVTVANQDYYLNNSSFTGTNGGVGVGTLSGRPGSCTPGPGGTNYKSPTGSYGVGYFATDTNTLYVCTATNTWTAIYTPYTYPHPLDGGSSPLNPPSISPASGSYASPQTVTISGPSGATICYTTDGSAPTATVPGTCDAGSTTYSGPFSLTIPAGGAVVEAISTESGQTNSSVASASYALQTCLSTPLGANWMCVADASNYTASSGTQLTAGPFSVNLPAGSLIVVFGLNGSNAACQAPTDTLGSPATAISTATIAADSLVVCDYYMVVGAGGADSVTCHAAATASQMGCAAVDVAGQSGGTIVDQSCTRSNAVTGTGLNNMNCSSSINVGQPNELVVAAGFGDYGTRTAGTNFTMIDPNNWSGEYFMEATPMIWTPGQTINASGLNYGFLAVTLEAYNSEPTPLAPTGLSVAVE
jgi:hypothetical protein